MTEDIMLYIKTRNLKTPETNYEFNFASRKFTLSTFLHTKHSYAVLEIYKFENFFPSEQMLQYLKRDFHFFTPYLFRNRFENISIKVKFNKSQLSSTRY
jgi:hypothetical protein